MIVRESSAAGSLRFRLGRASWLALWIAATLLLASGCDIGPQRPPSVILVTLDTTRADRLGIYGYSAATSPNIDAVASRGVVFESAISPASNTPVAHASILTGQLPYTHGLRVLHGTSRNRLPETATTLAEIFRDAGYRTAAFVSAFPVTARFGLTQGFQYFDADFLKGDETAAVLPGGTINTGTNQRRADETTDRALRWLAVQDDPFFLWVHYFDPHDVMLLPPTDFFDAKALGGLQRDRLLETYDAEVRYVDRELGRLLTFLDDEFRPNERIIAITADHGEGLGDHDWWTHGILYQEQIRVPLILEGRGVPPNRRITQTVRTTDVAPTLVSLAGLSGVGALQQMDGRSLESLFDDRDDSDDSIRGASRDTYSDSFNRMTYQIPTLDPLMAISDHHDAALIALVRGRYKYIHHVERPDESELFDLEADPKELDDLSAALPKVVAEMRAALAGRPWALADDAQDTPLSADERARLEALGYVGASTGEDD